MVEKAVQTNSQVEEFEAKGSSLKAGKNGKRGSIRFETTPYPNNDDKKVKLPVLELNRQYLKPHSKSGERGVSRSNSNSNRVSNILTLESKYLHKPKPRIQQRRAS